ncbi:MAG: hypothetical protein LUD77_06270, partial [Clostridiales bacterium]|nr:hypothetical protein [Clostridiales bacterium]
ILKELKNKNQSVLKKHRDMFLFNYWVIKNVKPINLLNREKIAMCIMKSIRSYLLVNRNSRDSFVNYAVNKPRNSIKDSSALNNGNSPEDTEKLSNDIIELIKMHCKNDMIEIIVNKINMRIGLLSPEKYGGRYEEYKKRKIRYSAL